jgi:hypothetical protein
VQQGFYVDVGANEPVCHSITKAFYERGWRGIDIEPVEVTAREQFPSICSSGRKRGCGMQL